MEAGSAGGVTERRFGRAGGGWIGTVAVFLVLFVLWLWCRSMTGSLIRITVAGDEVRAYFNGRLAAEGREAGMSREGGIGIWYRPEPYAGRPVPQTLMSVRVTDNASGELLFEQDFRQALSRDWEERPESCEPSREGLRCDRSKPVRLCTGARPWRDYTLDLKVWNCARINVAVRYRDPANHAVFSARPVRDVDSVLTFVTGGAEKAFRGGKPYYPAPQVAKRIFRIFMYYFPWWAFALAALAAAGCRFGLADDSRRAPHAVIESIFIAVLFAGGLAYLSWINLALLEGIPHVQDGVVYDFQAQMLSRGALYAPAPPNPPSFTFDFLFVENGKWFGNYPWGHPFLLMFGHLVGRPWIIPPLVGASMLVLIYLIARELFSREAAAMSALLAFFSPFFQVNAPNFMSHSSASFYLALGVFCLIRASRGGGRWWGLCSGLALGLFFNTRPLNALPAIVLSLALLLYFVYTRRTSWGVLLCFCAGVLLMLAFFLYANYVFMGHVLHSPYALTGDEISFFDEDHPLGVALLHYYSLMSLFFMVIFGWPAVFTMGFFLAFLLLAKKDIWVLFLVLLFVGITFINTLYTGMNAIVHMWGPRYVYETFFVFIMMAAAGWDRARVHAERMIEVFAASFHLRARAFSWITHAAFLALPAALVFGAQQKWLLRSGEFVSFPFMPGSLFEVKGYNNVSGEMLSKIRGRGIHHALIFVEESEADWSIYGTLFTLNSPFLDSDIIVARDRGPRENQILIDAFPGRSLFRVNVEKQEIRDYG